MPSTVCYVLCCLMSFVCCLLVDVMLFHVSCVLCCVVLCVVWCLICVVCSVLCVDSCLMANVSWVSFIDFVWLMCDW